MSRAHSQHRILAALKLTPMSCQQLQACLSLHRETVGQSVRALEVRNKVRRRRGEFRHGRFGTTPLAFELVDNNAAQPTIEGETP